MDTLRGHFHSHLLVIMWKTMSECLKIASITYKMSYEAHLTYRYIRALSGRQVSTEKPSDTLLWFFMFPKVINIVQLNGFKILAFTAEKET